MKLPKTFDAIDLFYAAYCLVTLERLADQKSLSRKQRKDSKVAYDWFVKEIFRAGESRCP